MPIDKCLECSIMSETQNTNGSYTVKYLDSTFEAFPMSNTLFKKDDVVYVFTIGGDLSKKRLILSLKTSTADQYIDLTKINVFSRNYLTDEDAVKVYKLQSGTSEITLHLQDDFLAEVKKQSDIVISATITSNLTLTLSATYGIALKILYEDGITREYNLTLNEVVGNPYMAIGYHDIIDMLYSDSKVVSIVSAKAYITGFDPTKTEEYVEFKNIRIGFVERTVASVANKVDTAVEEAVAQVKSDYEQAIADATDLITGTKGGNVVIRKDTSGYPKEILIMNTTDVATATRVWRWNAGGFGYSSTGYNGTYDTAITMDGKIVGSFITALTVSANDIVGGTLTSQNELSEFNLNLGTFKLGESLEFDGVNLTLGNNVIVEWSDVDGEGNTINHTNTVDDYVTQITNNSITAATIKANQIAIGGDNGVITWDDITDPSDPYQSLTQKLANLNVDVNVDLSNYYNKDELLANLKNIMVSGSLLTQIGEDYVITSKVYANQIMSGQMVGVTIKTVPDTDDTKPTYIQLQEQNISFMSKKSGTWKEVFKISCNPDDVGWVGGNDEGSQQIFFNENCSIDTNNGHARFRRDRFNYMSITDQDIIFRSRDGDTDSSHILFEINEEGVYYKGAPIAGAGSGYATFG